MKNSRRQSDLEEFISEANEVRAITSQRGWHILRRDIEEFLTSANKAIWHLEPGDKKAQELRINVLACEKLLEMVEDYEVNRFKAEQEWLKEEFPDLYVKSDVDNETPLTGEGG